MADMVLTVGYGSKSRIVKTVREVDQVQKFLAEYKRLLAEQERMSQAESLLFSAPPVPLAPASPPETASPVETAQPTEALPDVAADELLPTPAPLPSPSRGRPSLPSVGQRTIDYTLRVLEAAGGRLPFAQVVTGMQAIGWTTSSAEPRAITNNIRSAHNKYKEWVHIDGDLVVLTDVGRGVLRQLRMKDTTPEPTP